jgi:flavorubredoxin
MDDLQQVKELEKGVYWLGMRTDSRLEVNVYLRVFSGNQKTATMIIDPGPPTIFDKLQRRLTDVLGDSTNVQMAFINHQDPDVGTNAMFFQKRNPRLRVLCTEDTWRLTHFFGLKLKNFQPTDKFKNSRGKLSTGHIIRFVPTPFCHFRGACMLYDETSRILFSGDLFGGLTFEPRLFATTDNWDGIRIFHQIYMPSREVIRMAIDKIRRLKPAPTIIAPQHGTIMQGDLLNDFLEKMYDLPVGLDLLRPTILDKEIYLQAINEILDDIARRAGGDLVDTTLAQFASDGSFPSLFKFKGRQMLDIKEDNILASFKTLVDALMKDQPQETRAIIKEAVKKSNWNLPIFDEDLAEEEAPPSEALVDEIDEV